MTSPLPPELDFGPNLDDVAERLRSLGYFNSVQPYTAAALAIADGTALPPAAYVSIGAERAQPNLFIRDGTGHSQRVAVQISILFCVRAQNAASAADDELDQTRRAVIRLMIGWAPPKTEKALDFVSYAVRVAEDGLIWAEATFATTYRLDT